MRPVTLNHKTHKHTNTHMPIELAGPLVKKAADVAREMREQGLTEAPIPGMVGFFVSTDHAAKARLAPITVDRRTYFICQRMPV